MAKAKESALSIDTVITGKLLRGRVYVFEKHKFERGRPQVVSEDLAYQLEELYDTVYDHDGEPFDKALFRVTWDVDRASLEIEKSKKPRRRRRRLVEVDDDDDDYYEGSSIRRRPTAKSRRRRARR